MRQKSPETYEEKLAQLEELRDAAIHHASEAADPPAPEPKPEPEAAPEPEPVAPEAKRSFWSRFRRRREEPVVEAPTPAPPPAAPAPPPAPALDPVRAEAALTTVLDTLGAAHHRPFSRP